MHVVFAAGQGPACPAPASREAELSSCLLLLTASTHAAVRPVSLDDLCVINVILGSESGFNSKQMFLHIYWLIT